METPFPAYRGDEPYIFVCYSHEDSAVVFPELQRLGEGGVNVYYDEGISPGHEWTQELADAIDGCSRFLFFISPSSVASRHCRNEVQYALDQDKPVVSVYLEPMELTGGLRLSLGSAQAILKHELSAEEYRHKVSRTFGLSTPIGETPPDRSGAGQRAQPQRLRWWVTAVTLMLVVVSLLVWVTNRPSPQAPKLDRSIAVLPLSVVGDDPSMMTFADALTEEMRTVVSGYQELRVVVTDVAPPSEAEQLGYLLEGNLQHLGDRIRLRPRLTRADDGVTVWSKPFDRPRVSTFADPSELAKTAARFVRLQLVQDQQCESVRRATNSPEAASEYCAALGEFWRWAQVGDADLQLMGTRAQRSIDLDPEIVDAYFFLGTSILGIGVGQLDWRVAVAKASAVLEQGMALAPDNPLILGLKGRIEFEQLNYRQAKASFRASLAIDPDQPLVSVWHVELGRISLAEGRLDDALVQLRRAVRVNDANAAARAFYAYALLLADENNEAIRVVDEGLQLVETGAPYASLVGFKVIAQHAMGEIEQANVTLDEALSSIDPQWRAVLAPQLALLGREQDARSILAQLNSFGEPPVQLMFTTYVFLDDERVFDWIHRAIERHVLNVIMGLRLPLRSSPARQDPRWGEALTHLETEEASAHVGDGG